MDTNALLNFAFSIVASFTNIVGVPREAVPQKTNDLEAYRVGRPFFPLDVYLKHKLGTEFWIREGVVYYYESPGSYFNLQDPKLIPNFFGTAKLSSNEVSSLATRTVRRLVKAGDPLRNISPVVKPARPYNGNEIPFYDVTWPLPENPKVFYVARVGVDARSGQIVSLSLHDTGFWDLPYAREISNEVFRTKSPKNTRP